MPESIYNSERVEGMTCYGRMIGSVIKGCVAINKRVYQKGVLMIIKRVGKCQTMGMCDRTSEKNSTRPDSMMKKCSAGSPCLMIKSPENT